MQKKNKTSFPNNRPQLSLKGDSGEKKRDVLEFKTVLFTVLLYVFISGGLLTVHYVANAGWLAPAPELEEEAAATGNPESADEAEGASEEPHNHSNL